MLIVEVDKRANSSDLVCMINESNLNAEKNEYLKNVLQARKIFLNYIC